MELQSLITKLRLLEETADQVEAALFEDAEHVANTIAAAVRNGVSVRNTSVAKGISDPDQQLGKIAGTIAALWNVIQTKARDPEGRISTAKVAQLLKQMEVRPQDGATAAIIDAFAPTGDETKARWIKTISQYEGIVASQNQNQIKAAQAKLLPILNKMVTDIRTVVATASQTKAPQGSTPVNANTSLDFT